MGLWRILFRLTSDFGCFSFAVPAQLTIKTCRAKTLVSISRRLSRKLNGYDSLARLSRSVTCNRLHGRGREEGGEQKALKRLNASFAVTGQLLQ